MPLLPAVCPESRRKAELKMVLAQDEVPGSREKMLESLPGRQLLVRDNPFAPHIERER